MPGNVQAKISGPEFFIGRGDETLISFGSGQPDLPPPDEAYEILKKFRGFKYGQVQGEEPLRAALSKINPGTHSQEFIITNGGSEAIDLALRAIAQPGARVLMARPYYYSYPRNVELAGMTPVYTDLDKNGKINFEEFEREIRTCRAFIINSPSNPTGTVQDVETLKKIETLCDDLGVYILSTRSTRTYSMCARIIRCTVSVSSLSIPSQKPMRCADCAWGICIPPTCLL
jgi:aspartate/methionine/tyrosine aminotransferase